LKADHPLSNDNEMRQILSILIPIILTMPMQAQSDKFTRFRDTFRLELESVGIVGGSFVFIKDGKILAEDKYGSANLEKNQKVDENTIFHWASNTKPFTGIGIMQLRDRGLLKLSDPVTKYLPELRKIHNSFGSMDDITIEHLLTHSGGFRGGTWPWRNNKAWEPFEPTEWSQLVAMFPFTEVLFKPGSKYSYSNPGIIYLGRVIEVVSGESYETYIDKNIFRPLGMNQSYFDTTPIHLLEHRSHSYYVENGTRTEGRFDADTGITVSNSGLNAPVADMVRYLNFLVGDPINQTAYSRVLARTSLEEMWKPRLKAELDSNGDPGFTTDIGLIFFLDTGRGLKFITHGGDQNGFLSYIDVDLEKRSSSVMVVNTNVIYPPNTRSDKVSIARLRRAIRTLHR
jgi:CubicO group peptidase (beta-lactamase class C family)